MDDFLLDFGHGSLRGFSNFVIFVMINLLGLMFFNLLGGKSEEFKTKISDFLFNFGSMRFFVHLIMSSQFWVDGSYQCQGLILFYFFTFQGARQEFHQNVQLPVQFWTWFLETFSMCLMLKTSTQFRVNGCCQSQIIF